MVKSEYFCRTFSERDEVAVKQLVKNVFSRFLWGDYWDWKYSRNPNFDPSMVAVAEKDGKIVGCNHWLLRDFKLSSSLTTKALLCADIAVDPEHRKQGVGKSLLLFLRSTGIFKKKSVVVNYMFANPELSKRFYEPIIGYISVSTSTATYTKRLNWKKVMRRIEEMNRKMTLKRRVNGRIGKLNSKIAFHVLGAPQLTVIVKDGRIEAYEEKNVDHVNIKVKSNLATLMSLQERRHRGRRLLKALLTGKLRVRGNLLGIWRLYRNFDLLEEIFS